MSEQIKAPFTRSQVEALSIYQTERIMHPFTCGSGNRTDEKHLDREGILVPTPGGWICPYCDYTQDWAWDWMADQTKWPRWKLEERKKLVGSGPVGSLDNEQECGHKRERGE